MGKKEGNVYFIKLEVKPSLEHVITVNKTFLVSGNEMTLRPVKTITGEKARVLAKRMLKYTPPEVEGPVIMPTYTEIFLISLDREKSNKKTFLLTNTDRGRLRQCLAYGVGDTAVEMADFFELSWGYMPWEEELETDNKSSN